MKEDVNGYDDNEDEDKDDEEEGVNEYDNNDDDDYVISEPSKTGK